MYDNFGKLVNVRSILYSKDKVKIDLKNLRPGMYIVNIIKQESVEAHKILKVN